MKKLIILLLVLVIKLDLYALPSFHEIKSAYRKSDAVLLDRHGEVLHELRIGGKGRRLEWVGLRDLSPSLTRAVLHSEDKRFYQHHGVDWKAVTAATLKSFRSNDRGASTITMQLASMLYKPLRPSGARRTLSQKWEQMKAAEDIEKKWSKNEILEAYLNLVTFRGELQGISSAARGLFDKEPSGLDEAESLILASLIRSPNATAAEVVKRACLLGRSLRSQVPCDEIKKLGEKKLSGPYPIRPHIALAPHVARQLLQEEGARVASTLDAKLQRFATDALNHQLNAVKNQNVHDGAVLIVENKTGDVLAYIGNAGSSSSARYVDGIKSKRQAGSTLKPFLYELAIEQRLLTAASILDDSPLNVSTVAGLYIPHDYDSDFKGLVSVRTGLSSSLNVPAVRTLMMVGSEPFVNRLRDLGFESLTEPGDYYGLALALGSADVTLHELVNAYRALANNGIWSEMTFRLDHGRKAAKSVLKKEAVYIVSHILSDREARSATFGFENPLSTRFWTAAKTGTSKDMRDNWCIGYSQKYTVGVWVGNFTGQPMWNVSGITGAAPVWLEIMNYLHRSDPSLPPPPPAGMITRKVIFKGHIEPARDEWFIRGTEPRSIELDRDHRTPHITYPVNGTIIALDPDIPPEHHRLFFEAQTSHARVNWVLNGARIGLSDAPVAWKPRKGKYRLSLVDRENRVVDTVAFEVR